MQSIGEVVAVSSWASGTVAIHGSSAAHFAAAENFFTPENAPLVVLGFLGTGLAMFAVAGGALLSRLRGNRRRARALAAATLLGTCTYGAVLLAFSLASDEKTLRMEDKKYLCEIDCHLAYTVENLTRTKTLGPSSNSVTAAGTFYVVTLKTWFDERTISSRRGNFPLTPNPRTVYVVDASGQRFAPSTAAQKALEQVRGPSVPLTRSLRPGESYSTSLVFDLPSETREPRLLIANPAGVELFLIGHENSFFHKKIYFGLESGHSQSLQRSALNRA